MRTWKVDPRTTTPGKKLLNVLQIQRLWWRQLWTLDQSCLHIVSLTKVPQSPFLIHRWDISQIIQARTSKKNPDYSLCVRYLNPNSQLNFVQHAVNWDTIASATEEGKEKVSDWDQYWQLLQVTISVSEMKMLKRLLDTMVFLSSCSLCNRRYDLKWRF